MWHTVCVCVNTDNYKHSYELVREKVRVHVKKKECERHVARGMSISRKCNLIRLFTIHTEHMCSRNNMSKNIYIHPKTEHTLKWNKTMFTYMFLCHIQFYSILSDMCVSTLLLFHPTLPTVFLCD